MPGGHRPSRGEARRIAWLSGANAPVEAWVCSLLGEQRHSTTHTAALARTISHIPRHRRPSSPLLPRSSGLRPSLPHQLVSFLPLCCSGATHLGPGAPPPARPPAPHCTAAAPGGRGSASRRPGQGRDAIHAIPVGNIDTPNGHLEPRLHPNPSHLTRSSKSLVSPTPLTHTNPR